MEIKKEFIIELAFADGCVDALAYRTVFESLPNNIGNNSDRKHIAFDIVNKLQEVGIELKDKNRNS